MNNITEQSMLKFFQTSVGKEVFREINETIYSDVVSAAKYYMGVPDGRFFNSKEFDESVVTAKKAYVTLNTIMGTDSAEMDRFIEGKKQTPKLFTPLGVNKMISLFIHLFLFASNRSSKIHFETVRACRQSEISEGESIVTSLTSTTKLSVDEIMKLGYGNKNNLAICHYKFHDGAIIFDMEDLEKEYLKPEEREVLLIMGNRLVSHCCGYDDRYLGKDNLPALLYEIDVYPSHIISKSKNIETVKAIVYDEQTISEIQKFYMELNTSKDFPQIPLCYKGWKKNFQKLVFYELNQLI